MALLGCFGSLCRGWARGCCVWRQPTARAAAATTGSPGTAAAATATATTSTTTSSPCAAES